MPQPDMTLELTRLREQLAQLEAREQARRKVGKLLGYIDLIGAALLLVFGFFLYLDHDPLQMPILLSVLVLICVASNALAMAEPRKARRTPSH